MVRLNTSGHGNRLNASTSSFPQEIVISSAKNAEDFSNHAESARFQDFSAFSADELLVLCGNARRP